MHTCNVVSAPGQVPFGLSTVIETCVVPAGHAHVFVIGFGVRQPTLQPASGPCTHAPPYATLGVRPDVQLRTSVVPDVASSQLFASSHSTVSVKPTGQPQPAVYELREVHGFAVHSDVTA
jgi:hypothetical protein